MTAEKTQTGTRRAANLSLDRSLLDEAMKLGVNLSRAAEAGIAAAVAEARGKHWLEENADTIKGWNEYVDKHGLPLARHRQF
jgi:antitoxin CcdA